MQVFSQRSAVRGNQTSALRHDVWRCRSHRNTRDKCKSPQLSKLSAEMKENLALASQKLDTRPPLEFSPWRRPTQHDLPRRPERWLLRPDPVLIMKLFKTWVFCAILNPLFWGTSSKKRSVITPVHFGSRFTFFHQLWQMLTHCTLSSFLGKLSLFFYSTLTQTGDSIYFLSGRVYSLGYSLARRLFGKEFHSSSSSNSSACEVITSLKPRLPWFADRFSSSRSSRRR